jgi:hypothetical protein
MRVDFVRRQVIVNNQPITSPQRVAAAGAVRAQARPDQPRRALAQAWGTEFSHDVDYLRVWLQSPAAQADGRGRARPDRTASGMGYAFGLEEVEQGLNTT